MEKQKIILMGIFFLILPSVFALCTNNNVFSSTGDKTVCGYCQYKENNSLCGNSINCNLSVYYLNKTIIIDNLNMTNLGDGSFIYNITSLNLNTNNYLGLQCCSFEDYSGCSTFEIQINPSIVLLGGGGTSPYIYRTEFESYQKEQNKTKNIIADVKSIIANTAKRIFPTNYLVGIIIVISIIIAFIFNYEFVKFLKRRKIKERKYG